MEFGGEGLGVGGGGCRVWALEFRVFRILGLGFGGAGQE